MGRLRWCLLVAVTVVIWVVAVVGTETRAASSSDVVSPGRTLPKALNEQRRDKQGQASGEGTGSHARMAPAGSAAAVPGFQLWLVTGEGGGSASSATYSLSWTVGQNAVGMGKSGTFEMNRGFWQNFSTSCCVGKRGNINMVGIVDVSDLCALVSYLIGGGKSLPCYDQGNLSGGGVVDLADLSALVNYLTGGGYVLPNCR